MYVGHTAVLVGTTKLAVKDNQSIIYNPLYNPKTEKSEVYLRKDALADSPV
jgi:hypothetical protein